MLAWGKRLAGRTGPLAAASLRGGPAQQRVAARGIQYVLGLMHAVSSKQWDALDVSVCPLDRGLTTTGGPFSKPMCIQITGTSTRSGVTRTSATTCPRYVRVRMLPLPGAWCFRRRGTIPIDRLIDSADLL